MLVSRCDSAVAATLRGPRSGQSRVVAKVWRTRCGLMECPSSSSPSWRIARDIPPRPSGCPRHDTHSASPASASRAHSSSGRSTPTYRSSQQPRIQRTRPGPAGGGLAPSNPGGRGLRTGLRLGIRHLGGGGKRGDVGGEPDAPSYRADVAHRVDLGGVGIEPGAVDGHRAKPQHAGLAHDQQHQQAGRLEGDAVGAAEGAMVSWSGRRFAATYCTPRSRYVVRSIRRTEKMPLAQASISSAGSRRGSCRGSPPGIGHTANVPSGTQSTVATSKCARRPPAICPGRPAAARRPGRG